MLTQEYIKSTFTYKDGELFWKEDRGRNKTKGKVAGCSTSHEYKRIRLLGKSVYTHRLIFLYHKGYLPELVDHINGIKTDNRIENLRAGNKSINALNTGISSRNTSGARGVYFDKKRGKWIVMLSIEGKTKYFGGYNNYDFAKTVANHARNTYQKGYARHE